MERAIFWLLFALHLYPLNAIEFCQTLDGPAHLHNAILVKAMLSGSDAIGWRFFDPNYFPEPNWFSHFALALLSAFVSPDLAEKLLQIFCVAMLPISYLLLLRILGFKFIFAYYIFPFMYGFPFFLGFYNFCIGLSFALLAFASLIAYFKNPKPTSLLLLFFLITLTYFSHILSILFLVSLAALYLTAKVFYPTKTEGKKQLPIAVLRNIVMCFLPSIGLLLAYIVIQSGSGEIQFRSKAGLIHWIWQCRPVAAIDFAYEAKYSSLIGIFLLSSAVATVILQILAKKKIVQTSLVFLSASLIYALAFIIFPDSLATGGFINIRLLHFFFIALLLFIAANPIHELWTYTGALLITMVSLILLNFHFEKLNSIAPQGRHFILAADLIEPGSVILPLNYSENWLQSNLSNYLGTKSDVIVLDNYEAGKKPFPLKWKGGMNPFLLIVSFAGHPPHCPEIKNYEELSEETIDYISTWKFKKEFSDSCSVAIRDKLKSDFNRVFQSSDSLLLIYKRKYE